MRFQPQLEKGSRPRGEERKGKRDQGYGTKCDGDGGVGGQKLNARF